VQRAAGLPECATPADEIYALAKRRGMDFVTITDHDTIDGALQLADRRDTFVSEELTASFRGEPDAAVHVLCWGITPDDHDWLQAHATDLERCAAYLHDQAIACALAHPYYFVRKPLTTRHLRTLASLFGTWETRNGSRAREFNAPAELAAGLCGLAGSGGSDDHAGVDVGRTWTQTPPAETVAEFLDHLRGHAAAPGGAHGGALVWSHAPVALAARSLGTSRAGPPRLDAIRRIVKGALQQAPEREGAAPHGITPRDARDLLVAWLDAMELPREPRALLDALQDDANGHEALRRRARRAHERLLAGAIEALPRALEEGRVDLALASLLHACLPALPYVATAALVARERSRSRAGTADRAGRVALVADALDGVDGVTRLLGELRARGVPGWTVEVIGTDADVDRRLASAIDIELPYYAGRRVGVPSLVALADVLTDGSFDLVHVCSPGPAGIAATAIAEMAGLPLVVSHHTELARYARLRSGRADIERLVRSGLELLYRQAAIVLSPSGSADRSVEALGVEPGRVARWSRGVDTETFAPSRVRAASDVVRVLYAGRLSVEKGCDLLADAFLQAHARDPRLQLVLAGGGPEEDALRDRLGSLATFLGWLDRTELAQAHARADIFCFASRTDTFGQAVLEAQASGLSVLAVAEGGPLDLIEHGRSGVLCPPDAGALATALAELAADPRRRAAIGAAGAASARTRTWDAAFAQLAAAYERATSTAARSAAEWPRAA
jgi:glycosyltransferase involved in cell wall biosynthesis/predicted metal-dependent phosphoesterase TrpH